MITKSLLHNLLKAFIYPTKTHVDSKTFHFEAM